MARRTVGRRSVRPAPNPFIESPLSNDLLDTANDTEFSMERRRLRSARVDANDRLRAAENAEIAAQGLDQFHGDIEGPSKEHSKQLDAAEAEHRRLTGGTF